MRIGLNAQKLFRSRDYRNAGISRYIRQLVEELPLVGPEHEYVLFTNEGVPEWDGPSRANLVVLASSLPTTRPLVRILWEQLLLPLLARRHRLDVLHCPQNVAPLAQPCRTVVTIHDLTFVHFPERFPTLKRLYLRFATRRSALAAGHVVADSASTRADVIRHFGVAGDRVSVVYPGVDSSFTRHVDPARLAEFRVRQELPERYILYLGTLEPRKNVDRLVRGFARLAQDPAIPHALVLAGGKGWGYQAIFRAIEESGVGHRVMVAGYVPEEEKPLWYNAADLFVYPSQYEGFGLPPLEAMACGTPVIASNVSSLPEVVGEAGVLVDPADGEQLASAMRRVLTTPSLARELSERGMRQAGQFSWAKAARGCLAAYVRAGSDSCWSYPLRAPEQSRGSAPLAAKPPTADTDCKPASARDASSP